MILKASNIVKTFGEKPNITYAVNHVSLNVNEGEMLYIVGPSGSGKTTLLSIISGVLKPDSGTITIKNKEIWRLSNDDLADLRLYSIGFVFQDFHLFPRLTSIENVAIPLILQKKPWAHSLQEAKKMLDIVGLNNRADLPPYKLSIGEQQRVAIARAIVTQPDLLILDEPTASLDGDTGRKIIQFVKENLLNKNRAIIIVTHDNRIDEFASRIIKMEDGKIISSVGKDHES